MTIILVAGIKYSYSGNFHLYWNEFLANATIGSIGLIFRFIMLAILESVSESYAPHILEGDVIEKKFGVPCKKNVLNEPLFKANDDEDEGFDETYSQASSNYSGFNSPGSPETPRDEQDKSDMHDFLENRKVEIENDFYEGLRHERAAKVLNNKTEDQWTVQDRRILSKGDYDKDDTIEENKEWMEDRAKFHNDCVSNSTRRHNEALEKATKVGFQLTSQTTIPPQYDSEVDTGDNTSKNDEDTSKHEGEDDLASHTSNNGEPSSKRKRDDDLASHTSYKGGEPSAKR